MGIAIDGRVVEIDEEGYLIDPDDWSEAVARYFADRENINLTDEHWALIHCLRVYYEEYRTAAAVRYALKFLAIELNYGKTANQRLAELFPYGYVKQTCKIAGMKRPRAWSTG